MLQYIWICIRCLILKDIILLFGISGKVRLVEFQFFQVDKVVYRK